MISNDDRLFCDPTFPSVHLTRFAIPYNQTEEKEGENRAVCAKAYRALLIGPVDTVKHRHRLLQLRGYTREDKRRNDKHTN